MTYLQCLPDPAIVSKEDCEKIHEIIGRLSLNGKIKIDAVPSNFKQYSAPENHRKYFFYMRNPDVNRGGSMHVCVRACAGQSMGSVVFLYLPP